MIYHDEPTIFDLRTSYSIDESVAKMLGWMHGTVRVQSATQDKYGPIPRHLPHLYSLQYPLETHLQLLLDRAKYEYNEALQDNEIAKLYAENESAIDAASVLIAADAIVNEKYDQISHWNKVTEKALNYKRMIKEEFDKNELPGLEKDQSITDESGSVHIKLISLNDWAKQFGVAIIDAPEGLVGSTQKQQEQTIAAPVATYIAPKRADALGLILDDLLRANPELKPARAMKELSALIGIKNSVIISVFDEGVKWHRDDGSENDIEITSKDSVGERLRYWKKAQSKTNPRLT